MIHPRATARPPFVLYSKEIDKMAYDFRSARFWAWEIIAAALPEGGLAVDATLGNGHDALSLAKQVGTAGRVIGFDVQAAAIESSRARLAAEGLLDRCELILDGHQHMKKYLPAESADVVLFNLGWLPGAAHGVTTRTETTLQAVNAALDVLKFGGVMTICVYPGHEEGACEREALLAWAQRLDETRYDTMLRCYLNQSKNPPLMIAVKKNLRRKR